MAAVTDSNAQVLTWQQRGLIPGTFQFIQPYWSCSLSIVTTAGHCRCITKPKLPTHHVGINKVPAIFANSAPSTVYSHFHTTTLVVGSSNKAYISGRECWSRGWKAKEYFLHSWLEISAWLMTRLVMSVYIYICPCVSHSKLERRLPL